LGCHAAHGEGNAFFRVNWPPSSPTSAVSDWTILAIDDESDIAHVDNVGIHAAAHIFESAIWMFSGLILAVEHKLQMAEF
jgi:hypothetical protein